MYNLYLIEYSGRDISAEQYSKLINDATSLGWKRRDNRREEYTVFQSPDGAKRIYLFRGENKRWVGWVGGKEFRSPKQVIEWMNS